MTRNRCNQNQSPALKTKVGNKLNIQSEHTVNRMSSSLTKGLNGNKYHLNKKKVKTVQKRSPKQANTENQIRSTALERSVISILLGASIDFMAPTSPSVSIVVVVMLGLYVPTTAKIIRRRDLGLKSYQKDWRSPGSNDPWFTRRVA